MCLIIRIIFLLQVTCLIIMVTCSKELVLCYDNNLSAKNTTYMLKEMSEAMVLYIAHIGLCYRLIFLF